MRRLTPPPAILSQRGMSIVELMVGVAVGLLVTAAATMMVASQLADSRRLLLETQIQQDLRATADIIVRDLRRAGFWRDSHRGSAVAGELEGMLPNTYAAVSTDGVPDGEDADNAVDEITYAYASPTAVEDNAVTGDERGGFRLNAGVIQTQIGADNWQALTDGGTLRITQFRITPRNESFQLGCHRACSAGATPCPPRQTVRGFVIDIAGVAVSDATVLRSVRSYVRLRNDTIVGECRD
jgi:prepilin peptidase dependent protein B